MIGFGQHIRLRVWNDNAQGEDAIVADGVLEPSANIDFSFVEPQTVTRVSLRRITSEEAEAPVSEKGVKQTL